MAVQESSWFRTTEGRVATVLSLMVLTLIVLKATGQLELPLGGTGEESGSTDATPQSSGGPSQGPEDERPETKRELRNKTPYWLRD